MHIQIIKLTSMGDLIHALPALTDARNHYPDIRFDWVIDESFYEVATWHPSVQRVIKSAHRRWKRSWSKFFRSGEARQFYDDLNQQPVDFVLDAQSNLKSALITRLCRQERRGLDRHSIRESLAHFAYQKHFFVDKNQHAIQRQRELFAKALGYSLPETPPDYGINLPPMEQPSKLPTQPYLFFVHNASWTTKLWPNEFWQALIQQAHQRGFEIVLPSGNQEEFERAQLLADSNPTTHVLPRLSLTETAHWIRHAKGAICADTGLCHLAAALSVPSVSLYGPTDTALIGATGKFQVHMTDNRFSCRPCYRRQCHHQAPPSEEAACMRSITPDSVWQTFLTLLHESQQLDIQSINEEQV
ncbi:MAG: lipopolysaccharide heptosyltransferase I [Pseudomonadota bacterium]